jgi:hypothetical protein
MSINRTPNLKCAFCSNGLYRSQSEINKSKLGIFFCSRKHQLEYNASLRVPNSVCTYCEVGFWRQASRLGKSEFAFCSREHQALASHEVNGVLTYSTGPKATDTIRKAKSVKKLCSQCNRSSSEHLLENGTCFSCSYINKWLKGEESGTSLINNNILSRIKTYIKNLKGEKCWECGWNEVNPITGKIPVQVDHIDGNSDNNTLENLRLLCPNHHSLTPTFGNAGNRKGMSARTNRYKNKK